MSKIFNTDVQENENGEAFIEFPEQVISELGWDEGTVINWHANEDGTFTLSKVEATEEGVEWVLVETISSYRHRYMVQVPKGKAEYALDTVTMHEASEFSQHHIGELISSHRVVSVQEALEMCDVDNAYAKNWDDTIKQQTFFTAWDEKNV